MNPTAGLSNHTANVVALPLVCIINWFLAHLATEWVMPPEVQSALQALFTAIVTCWMTYRFGRLPPELAPPAAPPQPATGVVQ